MGHNEITLTDILIAAVVIVIYWPVVLIGSK